MYGAEQKTENEKWDNKFANKNLDMNVHLKWLSFGEIWFFSLDALISISFQCMLLEQSELDANGVHLKMHFRMP